MRHLAIFLVALVALAQGALAWAGNLEVAPTTIEVAGQGGSAVIYVSNREANPIAVQAQVFSWRQTESGDVLERADDVQISPPFARIPPGQRQIVRLLLPAASAAQRAYRVVLSELPDPEVAYQSSAVRVLLQFSIPIFVGDNAARPQLEWRGVLQDGALKIVAHNAGRGRAKLGDFRLVRANGSHSDIKLGSSRYVLAGATRSWPVKLDHVSIGEPLRIDGRDASGGASLTARITVAKP